MTSIYALPKKTVYNVPESTLQKVERYNQFVSDYCKQNNTDGIPMQAFIDNGIVHPTNDELLQVQLQDFCANPPRKVYLDSSELSKFGKVIYRYKYDAPRSVFGQNWKRSYIKWESVRIVGINGYEYFGRIYSSGYALLYVCNVKWDYQILVQSKELLQSDFTHVTGIMYPMGYVHPLAVKTGILKNELHSEVRRMYLQLRDNGHNRVLTSIAKKHEFNYKG